MKAYSVISGIALTFGKKAHFDRQRLDQQTLNLRVNVADYFSAPFFTFFHLNPQLKQTLFQKSNRKQPL
jgi:hypothetical protein